MPAASRRTVSARPNWTPGDDVFDAPKARKN
jgi:hypothetical protein